ncbi:MAG: D-sedoheptulose 7-phosphate isomerase [Alphaproteobacteria bacterium]
MNFEDFFNAEFDEHESVLRATRDAVRHDFRRLCEISITALKDGNKLVLFGNGGSAADAQHIAAELVVRYKANRAPLAAIALTTDSSILTATANDFGFEAIFVRQLTALCRPGDVAIAISTSGNSENVVRALQAARDMGVTPAAFSGNGGGRLKALADPLLIAPSRTVARVQEMHILLGHMLCDVLEQECL